MSNDIKLDGRPVHMATKTFILYTQQNTSCEIPAKLDRWCIKDIIKTAIEMLFKRFKQSTLMQDLFLNAEHRFYDL